MTGAKGYNKGDFRRFHNNADTASRKSGNVKVSVDFETASRYGRRMNITNNTPLSFRRTANANRAEYIAPDAEVVLMPGTLERAAIDELLTVELSSSTKKEHISLKEKIRKATHRESDAYTMYGVETREIFTEEIEIDVRDGAAFKIDEGIKMSAFNNDRKRSNTGTFDTLKSIKATAESKFRKFASKLNKLGTRKNSSAS